MFGVARNVARRHESKLPALAALPADLLADEATLEAEFVGVQTIQVP